jgi:3,4-dihydroxy 2-butanone 4-phosphate synthase/GTP cyclohydrolase II
MSLSPITDILADMKAGRLAVLVDEEDRENEGDLIFAADFVTPEKINFMAGSRPGLDLHVYHRGARGAAQSRARWFRRIARCTEPTSPCRSRRRRASRPGFPLPIARTPFASQLRRTQRHPTSCKPGHVFPLIAQPGGVLARAGHTEACCDLAGLAGLTPSAVLCEIMNADGTMARLPDLARFAAEHGFKIGAISDLIQYRSRTERLIERIAERPLATVHGAFRLVVYRDKLSDATHLALVRGPLSPDTETLVRVHEPLSVMDLLDTGHTSHSWSIAAALEAIARRGAASSSCCIVRRALRSSGAARSARSRRPHRKSIFAITGSAPRSCAISMSERCDSSRSRARCRAWRASISRSPATSSSRRRRAS